MKEKLLKINKDHIFYGLLIAYLMLISLSLIFRDMINDEALYFHETALLSELIKSGTWIGNYGVGLHGFLFKIPPAIIFLLTGPSVAVVTIYHIILTGIVGVLFYNLSSNILKSKLYGILSTAILFSNFHFLLSTVTYLREIPSLLVVLLVLNSILKKGNKYILSFLFLLLLDVKEYVFFIFALAYVIWLFITLKDTKFVKRVWLVIKLSFFIFLPSLLWILLMFTTNILPVNMFLATMIGLKDNAFAYLINHFESDLSTVNSLEGGRNMPLIFINDNWSPFIQSVCSFTNIILSYIGKALYPRVFSFLSVPKVVILPVVISSVITLKRYLRDRKEKTNQYAMLSLLILLWLLIYILRASHGRYLLPILPAIAIIYIYLLFYQQFSLKHKKFIIASTFLYITAGLFFETTYVLPKALLEYVMFSLFTISMFKPRLKILKYILVIFLSITSVSTAILFSYLQGQIYGYRSFGRNRNASEIVKLLPSEGNYWSNSYKNSALISALNGERYLSPTWRWKLHEIVGRSKDLKTLGTERSFNFLVEDMKIFQERIEEYDIETILFITTQAKGDSFPDQEYLEQFLSASWLQLDNRVEYTGMTVYIFTVSK